MVVFTCNYCGEAVKKPSIVKHYASKCRGSPNLTCVDCLKDFRGNEFESHIKCLTEDERYSAKGFVAKASSNKGERKQQSWFEAVQTMLNGETNLRDDERELLTVLSAHENLPRKHTKFVNFLQNAHRAYARRQELVERVWNLVEKAGKSALNNSQNDLKPSEKEETNGISEDSNGIEKIKKDKKRKSAKITNENGHDANEPEPKKGKIDPDTNDDSDKINILNNIITGEGGKLSLYRLNQKLEEYCTAEAQEEKKMKLLKKISKKVDISLDNGVITMNVDKLNK